MSRLNDCPRRCAHAATICDACHHEQWACERFDLYAVLYVLCAHYHSGQGSRGYRILSRLSRAHFRPGLALQQGRLETAAQQDLFERLRLKYGDRL